MPACTCSHAVERHTRPDNFATAQYTLSETVKIFTPGCPVCAPPGEEDDLFAFETPMVPVTPPSAPR